MSANNNEINLNSSGYAEATVNRSLAVAMNWPWERQRAYTQTCDSHGSHESLDLTGFTIEHNGVEHTPRDGAVMSYCPDCLGEFRMKNIEFSDSPAEEVIGEIVTSGTRWRDFRDGFEIAYLDEIGGLEYCPFCGSEFTASNQDHGRATCPEHGPLSVDVNQLREAGVEFGTED